MGIDEIHKEYDDKVNSDNATKVSKSDFLRKLFGVIGFSKLSLCDEVLE